MNFQTKRKKTKDNLKSDSFCFNQVSNPNFPTSTRSSKQVNFTDVSGLITPKTKGTLEEKGNSEGNNKFNIFQKKYEIKLLLKQKTSSPEINKLQIYSRSSFLTKETETFSSKKLNLIKNLSNLLNEK